MELEYADFSPLQWDLLATLEALGEPIEYTQMTALCAIGGAELADMIYRAGEMHLLVKQGTAFGLDRGLPIAVSCRLKSINSPERLNLIIERLEANHILGRLPLSARYNLLRRAGHDLNAGLTAEELARQALEEGRFDEALTRLDETLERIQTLPEPHERLLISAILMILYLALKLGRGLNRIPALLDQARAAAESLGERELLFDLSIIHSRLFQFQPQPAQALGIINATLKQVESHGAETLRQNSSELMGYYHFIQGQYREAAAHFEPGKEISVYPHNQLFQSFYLGRAYAISSQFHLAVGLLESNYHRALMLKEDGIATLFKCDLGLVLLAMHKADEALNHLQGALKLATDLQNPWAAFRAQLGLAYHAYHENRLRASYAHTVDAVATARKNGLIWPLKHAYWAWMLEMLYDFHQSNYAPIPEIELIPELERVIGEVNVHLKGVALRLKALLYLERGRDLDEAWRMLEDSEQCLKRAGDPVQLARTRSEMARLKLRQNDRPAARKLAMQAREGLSGYSENLLPEDLRCLIDAKHSNNQRPTEEILSEFLDALNTSLPSMDRDRLFQGLTRATADFFRAERGGIFWFNETASVPVLKSGHNLSMDDVNGPGFTDNLMLIIKSYRNNQPITLRPPLLKDPRGFKRAFTTLCLPFQFKGQPRGVIFLENSYLKNGADLIDAAVLERICRYASAHIEEIEFYSRHQLSLTNLAEELSTSHRRTPPNEIITQCPLMLSLLERAVQVAASDVNVLIQGDTGTGKELLARLIHTHSQQKDGPFVVLDPSSVNENLLESELFGHEKGAFSGADRTKPGRLELAHGGTLFIDEIGDIPLSIQVKLLRALHEKTFMRVGGTATIISDFRVVAATKRDLQREAAAGRFREDLYYRLNVVPLNLPPLRARSRDVELLAARFITYYTRRHGKPELKLSALDLDRLNSYAWPGNIRELKNVIERSVLLSSADSFELSLNYSSPGSALELIGDNPTMEELQRRYIQHVLALTGGKVSGPGGASEILGMNRTTLYSRMHKLRLD